MIRRIGYSIVSFAPEAEGGSPASGASSAASSSGESKSSAGPSASPPSGASTSSSSPSGGEVGASSASPGSASEPGSGSPQPSLSRVEDPFSGLGDSDLEEIVIPAEVSADPKKEAPKEPPKADAKPSGEEPKADAKAQEPPKAEPSPGEQGKSPLPDPSRPADLATSLEQNMDALIPTIAEQLFALSDKEKEALETDIIGTLPQLGARVFLRAQVNMMKQLQNIIPAMIEKHLSVKTKSSDLETRFYERWKDVGIDRAKHGDLVRKYGIAYRQAHPNAKFEEMLEDVGAMVMTVAKLSPVPKNGSAPSPQPGFVPAMGGPAAPPRVVSQNEFDGLGTVDTEE